MIGGTHYKNEGIPDHWDIVYALDWDYFVAAAVKYLWRLGKKGGPDKAVEDISKAIHYLEKKRELMMVEKANRPMDKSAGWDDPRLHLAMNDFKVSDVTGPGPGPGYVNQDR